MPRPQSKNPTELELEILKILWCEQPLSGREIRDQLEPVRDVTYTSVMTALKAEFGEKVQAAATKHVLEFQNWKRPKPMKMREFLSGHLTRKALALKHGTQMCPVTSGALLLDAANLGVNTRREIMGTIKHRSGKGASAELPDYAFVLEELEELAARTPQYLDVMLLAGPREGGSS